MSYVTCGNASAAYRIAYDAENCQPETIWTAACVLLKNAKVAARVKAFRKLWEDGVVVTRPFVQQTLMKLADSEDETISLNACKELSRHLGLHQTNVKHSIEGEVNHRHMHLEALKLVNKEYDHLIEHKKQVKATPILDAT